VSVFLLVRFIRVLASCDVYSKFTYWLIYYYYCYVCLKTETSTWIQIKSYEWLTKNTEIDAQVYLVVCTLTMMLWINFCSFRNVSF